VGSSSIIISAGLGARVMGLALYKRLEGVVEVQLSSPTLAGVGTCCRMV
jgi:mitochondrial fission protein ELM1